MEQNIYPYPIDTPGYISAKLDYYHKLSDENSRALKILQRWVIDNGIDMSELSKYGLHPTLTLLRYLRANQFDTEKVMDHISKNIAWRKDMNIGEIMTLSADEILQCSLSELVAVFPHWHSGYDKTGRPVVYKHYGKFDASMVKKMTSMENLTRYHTYEQEACTRLCTEQSHRLEQVIETCTGIIDVKDMKLSQVTSDFLSLIKALAAVDQMQYPETLGRIFIINTPSVFPFVWRMVKVWLDPAVAAKIQILGGPKEYQQVFNDFIGEENLPSTYGGKLPALSQSVHPYEAFNQILKSEAEASLRAQESVTNLSMLQQQETDRLKSDETLTSTPESIQDNDTSPELQGVAKKLRYQQQRGFKNVRKNFKKMMGYSKRSDLDQREGDEPCETEQVAPRNRESSRSQTSYDDQESYTVSGNGSDYGNETGELYYDGYDNYRERQQSRIGQAGKFLANQKMESNSPIEDTLNFDRLYENQLKNSNPPAADTPGSPIYHDWKDELNYLHKLELGIQRKAEFQNEQDQISQQSQKSSLQRVSSDSLDASAPSPSRTFTGCMWRVLRQVYMLIFENWLQGKTLKQVKYYLHIAFCMHMSVALIAMICSCYAVTTTSWISSIAIFELWSGVIVLLVSSLMMIINFVGYLGYRSNNTALLVMYAGCQGVGAFLLFIAAVACFLYASVPEFVGLGDEAVKSAFPNSHGREEASALIKQYNLIVGGGCISLAFCTFIPLILSISLIRKLRLEIIEQTIRQLQMVLQVAQCISIIAALVMLCYGAASLSFLFGIDFHGTVFPVYGLIYGGIAVILSASIGIWASNTVHENIVQIYYTYVVPAVTILLITASAISFGAIPGTSKLEANIQDVLFPNQGDNTDASHLKIQIQTQLLVTGVLCSFVSLFQGVSFFASRILFQRIVNFDARSESQELDFVGQFNVQKGIYQWSNQSRQLGKKYLRYSRTITEKLTIFWAAATGILFIFCCGTFGIFATAFSETKNADIYKSEVSNNFLLLWRLLGFIDRRYVNNDPFLVSSEIILAIFVGPLLLFYAWATFVHAPFRNILGIIACVVEIHSQVLYHAIEIRKGFVDLNGNNTAEVTVVLLLSVFFLVILPAIVLRNEIINVYRSTARSDAKDFFINANRMNDPQLRARDEPFQLRFLLSPKGYSYLWRKYFRGHRKLPSVRIDELVEKRQHNLWGSKLKSIDASQRLRSGSASSTASRSATADPHGSVNRDIYGYNHPSYSNIDLQNLHDSSSSAGSFSRSNRGGFLRKVFRRRSNASSTNANVPVSSLLNMGYEYISSTSNTGTGSIVTGNASSVLFNSSPMGEDASRARGGSIAMIV